MFPSRLAAASRRRALRAATLVAVFLLSIAPPAWSQPRTASVAVTVVDQTGAVIGGATVTITGTDDVTKAAGTAAVTTSNEGIANLAESGARPLHDRGAIHRVRTARAARRRAAAGRQQAGRAAHGGRVAGQRHGRARQAGSGGRPARPVVRHTAHARADRGALGRSRRCCGSSWRRWPAPAP